jgi:hypothetical protein
LGGRGEELGESPLLLTEAQEKPASKASSVADWLSLCPTAVGKVQGNGGLVTVPPGLCCQKISVLHTGLARAVSQQGEDLQHWWMPSYRAIFVASGSLGHAVRLFARSVSRRAGEGRWSNEVPSQRVPRGSHQPSVQWPPSRPVRKSHHSTQ